MSEPEYPIDVAFSFLAKDEAIARSIDDLLRDRLKTFLYSRRQGELVGKDGEVELARAFGTEARIVVVLHREDWGTTPWTRIEMNAIKGRAFDKGYDFALFVPLQKPAALPPWVPKTQIWLDWDRWGAKGAAPIIEQRVREAGGVTRETTAADVAASLEHKIQFDAQREAFRRSIEGVNAAREELNRLHSLLKEAAGKASTARVSFETEMGPRGTEPVLVVRYGGIAISVGQEIHWQNSLEGSSMGIILWQGRPPYLKGTPFEPPKKLSAETFVFDVDSSGEKAWREQAGDRFFTSEQIVDLALKVLLKGIDRARPARRD